MQNSCGTDTMGSGAPVSQSIPVSQQALGDVGVSAQTAAAPSSAVTLSPPGLGRSDIQIPVLEYGRTQPVWQEGFSQLSHQLEPPSHAVVMKPWDEVPVIPKNVSVWHRGVQGDHPARGMCCWRSCDLAALWAPNFSIITSQMRSLHAGNCWTPETWGFWDFCTFWL